MKKVLIVIILFFIMLTPINSHAYTEIEEECPDINARYAIVIDRNSKQILYGKNETEQSKMASTTKIMTCTIVLENACIEDSVTVSSKAAGTGGSRLGLSTNDKITVNDLLYGLMLRSGNDAAVALAEYVGGSVEGFVEMMNQKATELGLSSTHFVTPHGLDDDEHYTTAYDMAILTDYALQNEMFSKIVMTQNYTITINGYSKNLTNTNELLGNYEGIYGVKTGFTNGANRCLVTACKRGNLDVICVVFGCDTKKDRTNDSISLLNYVFNNYTVVNIETIINQNFEDWFLLHTNSFTIYKGSSQILNLCLNSDQIPYTLMAVKKSELDNISTSISFNSYYEAPMSPNTIIGELILKISDKNYFSIDIINTNSIDKKNIGDYFSFLMINYTKYLCNVF